MKVLKGFSKKDSNLLGVFFVLRFVGFRVERQRDKKRSHDGFLSQIEFCALVVKLGGGGFFLQGKQNQLESNQVE